MLLLTEDTIPKKSIEKLRKTRNIINLLPLHYYFLLQVAVPCAAESYGVLRKPYKLNNNLKIIFYLKYKEVTVA